jgi:tetratricopeptide (TPR) repeat protein
MQYLSEVEEYFSEGLDFYERGNYSAALNCFNQALKIDQEHYETWFYRGLILEFYDETEQAIESYERFLDIVLELDDSSVSST